MEIDWGVDKLGSYMNVVKRMQLLRMIEKINNNKNYSEILGVKNTSNWREKIQEQTVNKEDYNELELHV